MSNPFYRCLRQRDLSAKGCEPTVAYLIWDYFTLRDYLMGSIKSRIVRTQKIKQRCSTE
ncbi:MAG: hypothetical protein LBB88_06295 [Planctomycetaceae bacterium]|nr:hypothetical protein [Planctomycetaceae bacterium]